MANLSTTLYATQNNGGSPSVLISDIVALASTGGAPATTSTFGVVKQATHSPDAAAAFADLATAATAYNALLAALRVPGGPMAAS